MWPRSGPPKWHLPSSVWQSWPQTWKAVTPSSAESHSHTALAEKETDTVPVRHRQIFYAFPVKPLFPERHHPVWCGSSAGHPEVHLAIPLPGEHTEWNWTRNSFLVVKHQLCAKITSVWWVSSLIITLALAFIRCHALWTHDLSWSSNCCLKCQGRTYWRDVLNVPPASRKALGLSL